MTEIEQESIMTPSERLACERIAKSEETPHSQRALALLAVDAGKSQEDAATLSGLTPNQVKYWLGRFGSRRLAVFPDSVVKAAAQPPAEEESETSAISTSDQTEGEGVETAEASPATEEEPEASAIDTPYPTEGEGAETAEASPVTEEEPEASAIDTSDQTESEGVETAEASTETEEEPAPSAIESLEQTESKNVGSTETEPEAYVESESQEDQNNQRSIKMSESRFTKVEAYPVRGGKTYGYQQPEGAESSDVSSVAAKKEKAMDALEEFIDALASTFQPDTKGGGPDTETPVSQPTTVESPATEPKGGESPADQKPSTVETPTKEAELEEAYGESFARQRESFKMDRARESARAAESVSAPPPSQLAAGIPDNKHMSDSSTAPLQDAREYAPSIPVGSTSETMEVVAAPSGEAARSETAPAAPVVHGEVLDAYWGSFGTAVERAAERAKLSPLRYGESQQVYMELIIGNDDRIKVTNNEAYPWCCICSLIITAQTGSVYVGTGWLVSPRLVITAGHCVYLHNEGGWASQIEVIPGRDGTDKPFGSAISSAFRSIRGWTRDRDRDYDYGAILLPEDRRFGDQLGWFGFASREDSHFSGITLNLSGYPGDGGKAGPEREQGTQWFNSRGVKDVDEKQISYEIDTWGGQSGSPVWEMTSDGRRYGLAIHTWGTSISNGGTRITREVYDNFLSWSAEVP